jgi:type II secretory pathway component GspD/PulD (secretin)
LTAAEISSVDDLDAGLALNYRSRSAMAHLDAGQGDLWFDTLDGPLQGWDARLTALEESGKVHILSQPKIRTQSGNKATLFIGSEKFITVKVQYYRGQEVQFTTVPVGATLEVQPWTGGNGEITMTLKPSVSEIVARDANGLPTVDRRSASTTVRVKDGETLLIGGLQERSFYPNVRKIPILGDLPVIGGLFRRKQRSRTQGDLVFFVSARVVGTSGEGASTGQAGDALQPLESE